MKTAVLCLALLLISLLAMAVDQTKLEILNAGSNPIEVFWINPDGKRAPKGKIEPGKDRIIATTIGHRFVIVDSGKETEVVSSDRVQAFRYDPKSEGEKTNSYQERLMAGWKVQVSTNLIEQDAVAVEKAMQLLRAQLDEIVRVVPKAAVAELQKVLLWINSEYPKVHPRAEFHPDAEWLQNNGRDPVMAKGVEFTNVRIFEAETRRMPNFALHELAHAYHNRSVRMSFGNLEIKNAYEKAKASGKYDRVECKDSEGRSHMDRAYAMTNPQEYFAECTEAYFSRNDFFPFSRDELKQHDPEMFSLLEKLWKEPTK